ncbi:hypothetical protein RIF29_39774 [Crotalaria pallida]|uniref:Uncharacterized protein n=1 Tax=Crotalaria pallida TaxID=3830 RepID=A0AAN9E7A2_CROPI
MEPLHRRANNRGPRRRPPRLRLLHVLCALAVDSNQTANLTVPDLLRRRYWGPRKSRASLRRLLLAPATLVRYKTISNGTLANQVLPSPFESLDTLSLCACSSFSSSSLVLVEVGDLVVVGFSCPKQGHLSSCVVFVGVGLLICLRISRDDFTKSNEWTVEQVHEPRNIEETYILTKDGLSDLTSYTKDIVRVLRELKKSTPLASEMLKVLAEQTFCSKRERIDLNDEWDCGPK